VGKWGGCRLLLRRGERQERGKADVARRIRKGKTATLEFKGKNGETFDNPL